MNLTERLKEIGERLHCPMYPDMPCMRVHCAHYNPETDECVHVEAARAQVEAAEALVGIACCLNGLDIVLRRAEARNNAGA